MDSFSTGIGLEAQFMDSQIAEGVMNRLMSFMEEPVVVLPIHDSFIVRVGDQWILETAMKDVFKELTGSSSSVTRTGIKVNKHYGLSMEDVDNLPIKDQIQSQHELKEIMKQVNSFMGRYVRSWEQWKANSEV